MDTKHVTLVNSYRKLNKDWDDFYNDHKNNKEIDLDLCRDLFFEGALFETYATTDMALVDKLNMSINNLSEVI